jgi:hypothetical protein
MFQSNSIQCAHRVTYRAVCCAISALLIGLCPSACAVDFATVASAFGAPNVGWQLIDGNGDIVMHFDQGNSGPSRYVFDVGTQPWGAPIPPSAYLSDNGDGTVNITITDAFGNVNSLDNAADMEAITSWMGSLGFASEATGSGAGSSGGAAVTSGTVNLDSADAGNVQGVYQVALWIFGAVLMLPIILKVRPH